MNRTLVLTILSEDRPGIVKTLARIVSDHQGNWLESRLSHLAGKFAGIVQINLPESQIASLKVAMKALEASDGIQIASIEADDQFVKTKAKNLRFTLVGNDRPGIVRELSQAFLSHHINLEDLETRCSSMPWTGDPMFSASGLLSLPEDVNLEVLEEQLDAIADELGVDIELLDSEVEAS